MMIDERRMLEEMYRAFNARDIDAVLARLHPDVDWPNGMDGGRVHGRDAVREYWTGQWSVIDPRVEPVRFETDEEGRTVIDIHQVVRDPAGNLLVDQIVQHCYTIRDGLVVGMEIRTPSQSS